MTDLINRADAIEAVRMSEHRITIADEQGGVGTVKWDMWGVYTAEAVEAIKALPSADAVQGANLINRHDATTVIREECWKCNNLINADLLGRILALPTSRQTDCTEFVEWLIDVILDDEDWELNAVAYGEIIARKLKKLGLLEIKDGYYVRTPSADAVQGEWKPFDLTWGRNVYFCTACQESTEVPTVNGQPSYNFCPNCGAKMTKGGDSE